MKRALIVTIDGMIEKNEIGALESFCEVDWIVQDNIDETELANRAKDYDYLLLNFDIVKNLSEKFYDIVKDSNLKAISTDITGMDWARPKLAKEAGIALMNTTNYCTESVAEYAIMQIILFAKRVNLTYKDLNDGQKPEARKIPTAIIKPNIMK